MVIVEPITVPVAVSGGLGRFDLSVCANTREPIITPNSAIGSTFENIDFFIALDDLNVRLKRMLNLINSS